MLTDQINDNNKRKVYGILKGKPKTKLPPICRLLALPIPQGENKLLFHKIYLNLLINFALRGGEQSNVIGIAATAETRVRRRGWKRRVSMILIFKEPDQD